MKTQHHFDVDLAVKYGINAAILIDNFQFWVLKAAADADEAHWHEGRWWVYASLRSLGKLFPYMGKKGVENAMNKLLAEGVLLKGSFNKRAADRTSWYAFADGFLMLPISPQREMNVPQGDMDVPYGDSVTYTELNTEINNPLTPTKGEMDTTFDAFWNEYPKKVAKADARKAWNKLKPDPTLFATIIDALTAVKKSDSWTRDSGRFIPNPATWLNGRRWEDEQIQTQQSPPEERKPKYRRL